jgi:hypothetical protein
MPIIFDNVIGSVTDDTPQSLPINSQQTPVQSVPLITQLRKIDQRTRRLKAD